MFINITVLRLRSSGCELSLEAGLTSDGVVVGFIRELMI